jgi:hypothetical protein
MMDPEEFAERLAAVRETRARLPEIVRNRLAARRRRPVAGHTARLLLIEVDGPARGDLSAGGDAQALADRGELLRRLVIALERPGVSGVIATADVIDDLVLLDALNDRLAVGALNRVRAAPWSIIVSHRFTGYDPESISASHLDGGKLELSIDPASEDTAQALEACGRAITALSAGAAVAFVEPYWSGVDGADLSLPAMVRAVDVAASLGARSPFTWLVVPLVDDLARLLAATTLPVLLRFSGEGDLRGPALDPWVAALRVPGVRGLVASGSVLYPADGDVAAAVDALAISVHGSLDREEGAR